MKNKKYYDKILRYAKKLKSINYKGGKCKICGEENISMLVFHHINTTEKEFSYSSMKDRRWSILKNEIDKCDLLCQNCHRELHYNLSGNDGKIRIDKKIYLEYGGSECERCGYNKCPASLTFHHTDPDKKEFWIGGLSERINSISDLDNTIKNEIDKCDILCANCHSEEHFDRKFFNENIEIIKEKSISYKEIRHRIDRNLIYELYFEKGLRQIDIIKKLNIPKGTLSGIIKELRNND